MDRSISVIDVRGMCCPRYIIEAKWALDHCRPGAAVRVLATDPDFPRDFAAFCRQTGHRIIESSASNREFAFLVKKGGARRLAA
jgi:tRNA 2-thiouridine synthesizing protein A